MGKLSNKILNAEAITPDALRQYAIDNFEFNNLIEHINSLLKQNSLRRNVCNKYPIKISVKVVPQWVIDKVVDVYLLSGWATIRVSEDNGQFITFEFYPT